MLDVSTMVNSKLYNRLPQFREEIKRKLREDLLRIEKESELALDWTTEVVEAVQVKKENNCGCGGHNMIVILKVDYLTNV